jgi:hypothetical protein
MKFVMDLKLDENGDRREIRIYHSLPTIAALMLVAIYMGLSYLTNSSLLSGIVAGAISMCIMWRWIVAARRVDQMVCTECGRSLRGRMPWIYPPKKCKYCGHSRS